MKPYWSSPIVDLYCGDALAVLRELPECSVQMCVTSPPFWGLRDYRVDGQLGLESTPEEYVANLVAVLREVKRVLRDDGTVWCNLGDSYAGSGKGTGGTVEASAKQKTNRGANFLHGIPTPPPTIPIGLKAKDLVGIPWMVAFALRADGWWLRSDIIWAKPNPMPESVLDRPTKAHEYLFLLSKSASYYYDAEAIKEPSLEQDWDSRYERAEVDHKSMPDAVRNGIRPRKTNKKRGHSRRHAGFNDRWDGMTKAEQGARGRNKRTVWTIATAPYSGAHFATFPQALVEPCILAGTSERGCCSICGTPWKRVVKRTPYHDHLTTNPGKTMDGPYAKQEAIRNGAMVTTETIGWHTACAHPDAPTVPCVVLDPFTGSGTTNEVAQRFGRKSIGIDLSEPYLKLAAKRIESVPLHMNLSIEVQP